MISVPVGMIFDEDGNGVPDDCDDPDGWIAVPKGYRYRIISLCSMAGDRIGSTVATLGMWMAMV